MHREQWEEAKRSKIVSIRNKLLIEINLKSFLCEIKANEINEQQKIKFERN